MPQFDTQQKSIKMWLGNSGGDENIQFIIPEYQRPYEWILQQCQQLWEDITKT